MIDLAEIAKLVDAVDAAEEAEVDSLDILDSLRTRLEVLAGRATGSSAGDYLSPYFADEN
jgi:hypothetical protein